jgi:hypothetical protein
MCNLDVMLGLVAGGALLAWSPSVAADLPALPPPAPVAPSATSIEEAPPAGEKAASAPTPSPAATSPALTPAQIKSFAEVVDDKEDAVHERLMNDPSLLPAALRAVDARESRHRSGTTMAVAGFSIAGIGQIAGTIVALTAPGYPLVQTDAGRQQLIVGLAVAVLAHAVGLPIAVPGVVRLASASDLEKQVAGEYHQADRPPQSSPGPAAPPPPPPSRPGSAVVLPLLSGSF